MFYQQTLQAIPGQGGKKRIGKELSPLYRWTSKSFTWPELSHARSTLEKNWAVKAQVQLALQCTNFVGSQWAVPSWDLNDFLYRLVTVPASQGVGQIERDDVFRVLPGHEPWRECPHGVVLSRI